MSPLSHTSSPPSSPPRKKLRSSSPLCDDFSQEEIDAFDLIMSRHNSAEFKPEVATEVPASASQRGFMQASQLDAIQHLPGPSSSGFTPASQIPASQSGFVKGSQAPTFSPGLAPASQFNPSQSGFLKGSQLPSVPRPQDASQPVSRHKPAPAFTSAAAFSSARSVSGIDISNAFTHDRSPSPEPAPEQDWSSWFDSSTSRDVPVVVSFAPARILCSASQNTSFRSPLIRRPDAPADKADAIPSKETSEARHEMTDTSVDFAKASSTSLFSKASSAAVFSIASSTVVPSEASSADESTLPTKVLLLPSKAALEKAKQRMQEIWDGADDDVDHIQETPTSHASKPSPQQFNASFSSARSALPPAPQLNRTPAPPSTGPSHPHGFVSSLAHRPPPKPFKPPLLNSTLPSPLNPHRTTGGLLATPTRRVDSPAIFSVTPGYPPSSPLRSSATASYGTPLRRPPLVAGTRGNTPAKFTTPFKKGMRPGELGRAALEASARENARPSDASSYSKVVFDKGKEKAVPQSDGRSRSVVFKLEPPARRITLAESGCLPQTYAKDELEEYGVRADELLQITPTTAPYYCFHDPDADPGGPPVLLGAAQAFEALLTRGCGSLLTKPWVDNHWALILWKLAGHIALDPRDGQIDRWSFKTIVDQLCYRFEREINQARRPALRLITTRDATPAAPMVLCVSNITWGDPVVGENGSPTEPRPELEVTDGWYRLRAQIDAPMARAVRRGVIRIGRKIAISGARLGPPGKEPREVLEAYNSMHLILSGNSTHLAPWHAKLGFQVHGGPYVATLNSLTAGGGAVCLVDVVIKRTFPVAFFEFFEDEDGNRRREGPRNEQAQAKADDEYKRKRETVASKLLDEHEKKVHRYTDYADRLERRAGGRPCPLDTDPPDHIDGLYDQLEEPAGANMVLSTINASDAAWLAHMIREQTDQERERFNEELEREMQRVCPPRNIRSFRVVVVQDAQTCRRPQIRSAQLTVWDVTTLELYEGRPPGTVEVGHRFLITNLMPIQQSSWMDSSEPGAEIYLATRRDSRWRRIV